MRASKNWLADRRLVRLYSRLVLAASARLGISPERCTVIGDIGADIEAARAAGAQAVLVPTTVTRPEEIASAPVVADDVLEAVRRVVAESANE